MRKFNIGRAAIIINNLEGAQHTFLVPFLLFPIMQGGREEEGEKVVWYTIHRGVANSNSSTSGGGASPCMHMGPVI